MDRQYFEVVPIRNDPNHLELLARCRTKADPQAQKTLLPYFISVVMLLETGVDKADKSASKKFRISKKLG